MRRIVSCLVAAVLVAAGAAGCGIGATKEAQPSPSVSAPVGAPNPKAPTSMAALGDSITRGVNACTAIGECVEANWATGTSPAVASHAERLRAAHPGQEVAVANYADAGARIAALPGQASQAAGKAGYVTVLIGANDACSASPVSAAEFGAYAEAALSTLVAADEDVKILVASVPNLYRLWETGRGSERARWVWGLDVCAPMLGNTDSDAVADEQRRQHVLSIVQGYNQALSQACAVFPGNCRWDKGAVYESDMVLSDLSGIDFFHPSLAGQRRLAETLWKAGYDW